MGYLKFSKHFIMVSHGRLRVALKSDVTVM